MIVIADRPGQLGNQLLLFGNLLAWAREYSEKVSYPAFAEYAQFFEGTVNKPFWAAYPSSNRTESSKYGPRLHRHHRAAYLCGRLAARALPSVNRSTKRISLPWMSQCDLESSSFRSLSQQYEVLFLEGWLYRAPNLVAKHRAFLSELFLPVESVRSRAHRAVSDLRKKVDVTVGVHIRQGDYNVNFNRRYFLETESYVELMKQVVELYSGAHVGFLISSNVAQRKDAFEGFTFEMGPGDAVADLRALQLTDLIIGPPSSFSLWAALTESKPLIWVTSMDHWINVNEAAIPPAHAVSSAPPLYWGLP